MNNKPNTQLARWSFFEVERVPMRSNHISTVMPALVASIHVFLPAFSPQDVDGRDKPGHDSE
jgi:hypothetical protein